MYDPKVLGLKFGAAAGSAGSAGAAGPLAHGGALGIAWGLVAGFTLVMAALAVRQLLPSRRA
jgi:hypothetical protein